MTKRELLERRILLIKQSLTLAMSDKSDFEKKLGGKVAFQKWLDNQLDQLIQLQKELRKLN